MLGTKKFYETMDHFEKHASKMIRTGSQGFTRASKDEWQKQRYYNDGEANTAFKIFLFGYSFGKINNENV